MNGAPMNVVVHIDRLVLDGVALEAGQQHLLQAAVQAELARLLAAGALAPGLVPNLAAGMAVPRIAGAPLALPAGAGGSQAGRGIAGSVYAAIGGVAP